MRHRWRTSERGASTLELAMLTPLLLIVIMLVVQFAMVYHAQHVALAAAQDAARVARGTPDGGWKGAAEQKGRSAVTQYGSRLLTSVQVRAGGDGTQRWVEVRGKAVQVVPGFTFNVAKRSAGPIECFRPDDGGTDCQRP